jgi:peptide/nickel transport system permease protein
MQPVADPFVAAETQLDGPDAAAQSNMPLLDSAGPADGARTTVWRRLLRHRAGTTGALLLMAILLACAFGPWLSPYDPNRIDVALRSLPPTAAHWLGTDELGRDQLTRILVGGRLSLATGLATVALAMLLGVGVGALAGWAGGWIDGVLMRLVDAFISIPGLFVLIVAVATLGVSFWTIALTLALLNWMSTARLVRSSVLTLKGQEFVEAARVLGAGDTHIVVRHVLPNALGPIVVSATLGVATAILAESTLSFLGLGYQPPDATWGRMLQEAQVPVLQDGHWWRGLFPGLAIFLTVLAVNFLGDALRDAFDPRSR